MVRIVGRTILAAAVILTLAAAEARANPDIWVRAAMTFAFEDHKVSGVAFSWSFDDYYSSHAIRTYDVDGDGALGAAEVERLRAEAFDPLARVDYYVHIWAGDGKRQGHSVERFAARIDGTRLVYEFSLPLAPPLDPRGHALTVSLFDRETVVDLRLSEKAFLLVSGAMPAGCKFRIARGGEAQSGHPQPVTLACGD